MARGIAGALAVDHAGNALSLITAAGERLRFAPGEAPAASR